MKKRTKMWIGVGLGLLLMIGLYFLLGLGHDANNDYLKRVKAIDEQFANNIKQIDNDKYSCRNVTASDMICKNMNYNGEVKCQGLVYNNCDYNMTFMKVIGIYYDNNSKFIGTSETYTTPSSIDAGGFAPFTLYTDEDSEDFYTYNLSFEWNYEIN
jgi:hypothetical protein